MTLFLTDKYCFSFRIPNKHLAILLAPKPANSFGGIKATFEISQSGSLNSQGKSKIWQSSNTSVTTPFSLWEWGPLLSAVNGGSRKCHGIAYGSLSHPRHLRSRPVRCSEDLMVYTSAFGCTWTGLTDRCMYLQMRGDITVRKPLDTPSSWINAARSSIFQLNLVASEETGCNKNKTEMIAETILFVLKALNVSNLKSVLVQYIPITIVKWQNTLYSFLILLKWISIVW